MQLIRLEYANVAVPDHRINSVPALEKVNAGPYMYSGSFPRSIAVDIQEIDFYKHPIWYDDRLEYEADVCTKHVFGFMTKDQFFAWFDVREKLLEFANDLRVAVYEGPAEAFHHGRKQSIADVNELHLEKVLAIEEFLE